jgi:hypothetical protein
VVRHTTRGKKAGEVDVEKIEAIEGHRARRARGGFQADVWD